MRRQKAVVIGAGFGGLAAALRLAARGCEVTVVDQLSEPGGRARVFRRNGFVFDAGPTILTAPFLIDELFALHGARTADYVDIRPIDPWYRLRFDDGRSFDYGADEEALAAELRSFDPAAVDAYNRFLRDTEPIYRIGFERLGDQPFHTVGSMLRALPQMARLRSDRTVWQRTRRYFKEPHLRQAFSFHPLLVGGNPFRTTSIYSLIHYLERHGGVHFAMGGTGALVAGLVRLMDEVGIERRHGAKVRQVAVRDGRAAGVTLDDGQMLDADLVVANADAATVYSRLVPEAYRGRWSDQKLGRLRYSMGLFVLYFGTTRRYPDVAHHEIILGPRYRELIGDIFDRHRLAEDMSLYLHVPTRTDPSLAPPGCESMYALVPVPNLRAGLDWETQGPALRDRVVARLEETVLPGLGESIVEDFFVTPRYFEEDLGSLHGAGFSIQPTLMQSAYFRFHNRSGSLPGLYLVGAGTHPGAGVPGVLTTAKVLDNVLDEEGSLPRRRPSRARTGAPPHPAAADHRAAARAMAAHATTFSAAARLLPASRRTEVEQLYAFCRHVDDLADRATDPQAARSRLRQVRSALDGGAADHSAVTGFLALAHRYPAARRHAHDLLDGVVSDLGTVRIASQGELLAYAYRVAGSVGRMLCDLLGAADPRAAAHAIDLGLAMQLSNIARDVGEDWGNGRCYLPAEWVAPEVVERAVAGGDEAAEREVLAALRRLLELADRCYASAEAGIAYLPPALRPAILGAARAYRAIGPRVLELGAVALRHRAFVPAPRRWTILLRAAATAVIHPRFWRRGRRPVHDADLHRPLAAAGLLGK